MYQVEKQLTYERERKMKQITKIIKTLKKNKTNYWKRIEQFYDWYKYLWSDIEQKILDYELNNKKTILKEWKEKGESKTQKEFLKNLKNTKQYRQLQNLEKRIILKGKNKWNVKNTNTKY